MCVIAGATGSGKTEVLQRLRRLGQQVCDLEGLAHHRGSVFGHLGEAAQPTSEHFRNLAAVEWATLDPERFVFLEDEGSRIGSVCVPAPLYHRVRSAHCVVRLDVPFALRAERSLATYGPFGPDALGQAVNSFRHRMGDKRTDELLARLARGELRYVCEEALRNYDRSYDYHLRKGRDPSCMFSVSVDTLDVTAAAEAVLAIALPRESSAPLVPQPSPPEAPLFNGEGDVRGAAERGGAAGGAATTQQAQGLRQARCFCGRVEVRVSGCPLTVSICHCSVCRRLSGAPSVASVLLQPKQVEVLATDGGDLPLVETRTSEAVVRLRCAGCFSPVVARLGARYVAVPLSLFDWGEEPPPAEWRPQHHLHYGSRVLDAEDDLPKYKGRSQGPHWQPLVAVDAGIQSGDSGPAGAQT